MWEKNRSICIDNNKTLELSIVKNIDIIIIFDQKHFIEMYIPEIENHTQRQTRVVKRSYPNEKNFLHIEKKVKQIFIYHEKYKSNMKINSHAGRHLQWVHRCIYIKKRKKTLL